MIYPKPVMTITELAGLGFSKTQLYEAAHHRLSGRYVIKSPGGRKIRFDTAEFEKIRQVVMR